jgi:hypothetical protein
VQSSGGSIEFIAWERKSGCPGTNAFPSFSSLLL